MNRDQKKHLAREKRRLQREKHARLQKDINDILEAETDIELDEYEQEEPIEDVKPIEEVPVVETQEIVPEVAPEIVEIPEEKQSSVDIDVLVLEATLARDKRNMSFAEGIKDMVTKAVLTSAAEDKLSDDQFALVREEGGKKVRKYPIHDKAHVRNALARAAQMMKKGDKDAKAAMPKIRAAAKKMGIEMSMEKDANAVQIEKDANGDWRAVMWVSNNFIDWDGDIISEEAHSEYVDWVNKNKECMPAFVTWHTPGTARENPVDYVDYFNGFLVASAKLTEAEAVGLLKANKVTNIGMSHGSFVLGRDPKDQRVITKYRMYEVSDLPLDKAANPFTDFETISKEVGMDKKEYLTTLLGDAEKAEAFLEKTGLKQKALQEAEIESKDKTEDVPPVTEPAPEVPPVEEPVTKDKEVIPDLVAQVLKEMDIEGLNSFVLEAKVAMEKVPVLEALIKELSADKDEKLAEMIAPPITKTMAWSRPSEKKENVIKKDDELTKKIPGLPEGYWLSKATNTAPIKEVV